MSACGTYEYDNEEDKVMDKDNDFLIELVSYNVKFYHRKIGQNVFTLRVKFVQ